MGMFCQPGVHLGVQPISKLRCYHPRGVGVSRGADPHPAYINFQISRPQALTTKPAPSQMVSAMRSAIAAVVRLVLARGMVGMIEASATNKPSIPRTSPCRPTAEPMGQVPAGWK